MDQFAELNEPLVLADGTKIDTTTGEVLYDSLVEVPSATEAIKLVTKTRKRIADLPDVPQRMHVVGAVLSYRLFGFDDAEIALALNLTDAQVGRIVISDAYTTLHREVVNSILHSETDSVRSLFEQGARRAAENVVKISSRTDALGFRAARDVLDRAGMRPADVVEHRHMMDGQLQIVHIRRDKHDDLPVIEGFANASD